MSAATRFALIYAALTAAHEVGDHWVQTSHQACTKGEPGYRGSAACAAHVATYTATGAVAVLAGARWLRLPLRGRALAAGLAISAVSHYVVDRRTPLRALAAATGSAGYIEHTTVLRRAGEAADDTGPGTGLFHLDQAWHHGWILIAALAGAGRS
jgi:hypothetical protein